MIGACDWRVFAGGAYCASIAAVEAYLLVAWDSTSAALADVYDDLLVIQVCLCRLPVLHVCTGP